MKNKSFSFACGLGLLLSLLAVATNQEACAISASELQAALSKGEKVTAIDIRTPELFRRSHIPGAINIPASLCAQKRLPPLGRVVVYGGGLGLDSPKAAAAALAAKPGLNVSLLDGGFAAWESLHAPTTRAQNMEPEAQQYIAYADLRTLDANEYVLIDLRKSPNAVQEAAAGTGQTVQEPLTDLAAEFPKARISSSAFNLPSAVKAAQGAPPLLILIDSGDGTAQATARMLTAAGSKRYVILAGGESILARKGQAGLQRSSPGIRIVNQTPPPAGAR